MRPEPGSNTLDSAGKAAAADAHWQQTEQILKDTIQRLDKIIGEAAETV